MRKILYISGWMGAGEQSATFRFLKKRFYNLICVPSGGAVDISEVLELCRKIIKEDNPLIVANSYGCFISSFFDQPAVWINPCLFPSTTLAQFGLSEEELAQVTRNEQERNKNFRKSDKYWAVCAETDPIVGDHRVIEMSTNEPIIIPGCCSHKLSNAERKEYVLPLIKKLLEY